MKTWRIPAKIRCCAQRVGVLAKAVIALELAPKHEVGNGSLITHNFVIEWFVRHMLDAAVWRWIGLNQANCAITIVQWDSDRPPTLVSFNDTGDL